MNVIFQNNKVSSPQYNYQMQAKRISASVSGQKYNNLAPLKSDTVSFGDAHFIVKPRFFKSKDYHPITFQDFLLEHYILENPRLMRIARVYYAVLQSVASTKSEVFGICDNVEHLVKSPKSIIEKILRSGSLDIPDTIRATAFCENPYNLDNLVYILGEMEKSGYVVDKVPVKVSKLMDKGYVPYDEERMIMQYLSNPKDKGVTNAVYDFFKANDYDVNEVKALLSEFKLLGREPEKQEFLESFSKLTKKVPDLDIRLDPKRITPEQKNKLPEMYRYCISHPQDSGYEDIQVRFIRGYVKKSDRKSQIPHELIILFGKNYYDAKTRESTYVYSNLRKFKELTVKRYLDNPNYDHVTELLKSTIASIERLFRAELSEKEFMNAKHADFIKDNKKDKILFTEDDIKSFDDYFKILISEVGRPYNTAMKKMLIGKRSGLRRSLAEDRKTIREIRDNLRETIDLYNSGKAYKLTEPKPKKSKKKKSKKIDTEA